MSVPFQQPRLSRPRARRPGRVPSPGLLLSLVLICTSLSPSSLPLHVLGVVTVQRVGTSMRLCAYSCVRGCACARCTGSGAWAQMRQEAGR